MTLRPSLCVCRRGVVHSAAVRRAVGVVRPAAEGVPQLPHAERVAEKGVPPSHHRPELRQGQGEHRHTPFFFNISGRETFVASAA